MKHNDVELTLATIEHNTAARDFRRQVLLDDLIEFEETDEPIKRMAIGSLTSTLNSQEFLIKLMGNDQSWADKL